MKFTVYSRSGCPYCDKIKAVFKLANLEHTVYELDVDFTRQEFYEKFGRGDGVTFPRILKDDVLIGGCTETVKYLTENNLV